MATAAQYQVLSTPAVYVDGAEIKIIPNSLAQPEPGVRSVRAVSAGGAAVSHVVGNDAAEMKGRVTFRMAVTAETVDLIEGWVAKANDLDPVTVTVVTRARTSSYRQMWLTDAPEYSYEAEGEVEVAFEGSTPVHG